MAQAAIRERSRSTALLLGLASSTVAILLLAPIPVPGLGLLQGWEGVVADAAVRLRGERPPEAPVRIVAIDRRSIDGFGRWPWPRTEVAELVDRVAAAGARTIALDAVFSEPTRSPPGLDLSPADGRLAESLERAGNGVLGYFFRTSPPELDPQRPGLGPGETPERIAGPRFRVVGGPFAVRERPAVEVNLEPFARAAAAQGFFNHETEAGIQRHYSTATRYRGRYYPALALAAAAHFLGEPLALVRDGALFEVLLGERRLVIDSEGRLRVNYLARDGGVPTVSAADVLLGRVPGDAFEGALVFVGLTETGVGDFITSPFGSQLPGVAVHATVAENVLAGNYVRDDFYTLLASLLAVFVFGLLVAWVLVMARSFWNGFLWASLLLLLWPALAYLAFHFRGWHLWFVAPVAAGVSSLVLSLRYQGGWVEQRARWIQETFQRYVSRAVVEELMANPEAVSLSAERRDMTVLFCDIRGFTSMSEDREPEEVAAVLNQFFTPMTRVVTDHRGTLDKYMGDALMAFFGAPGPPMPDHAERACRAALEMGRELEELNRRWRRQGEESGAGRPPRLGMGVGLNSGEMSVGNMGSEQKFDYTVLGDNVNLGSRVEGLSRRYGVEVVVTDQTREAAGEGFLFRELDWVQVKGREQPATIYELVAEAGDENFRELRERVERFEAGLELYRRRRFEEAAEVFAPLAEAGDGPAAVFLERCRTFRAEPPPEDWDAVERLTSK